MYPILVSIGGLNIYTHGLLIALGGLAGGFSIYYLAKRNSFKTNFIFDLIVYSLLGGLVGARILYVIIYYNQLNSFWEVFYIWYGGLISYGGFIGGLLIAALFLSIKKEKILAWFDIGIIGLNIGWFFGRLGCLLAGDSFGLVSGNKVAIWGRIPTQLFESILGLIIAVICYFGLKYKNNHRLPDGLVFLSGIGFYGIGRFIIDFWRDENIVLWQLKTGQLGSLFTILLAIISIIILLKKARRQNGF